MNKTGEKIKTLPFSFKSLHNPDDISDAEMLRYQKDDERCFQPQQYYMLHELETKEFTAIKGKSKADEQKFDKLAKNWFEETAHLSLVRQQIAHMSFLKIVGMGKTALPFVFREFEKIPMLAWLFALEGIVGEDVASDAKTHKDAVNTWLDWGRKNGYR